GTKLETLRVGFAALGGGQAQGNRAFNETFQQAQRLGLEFTSLAQAYRRFEGATRGTALEGERGRAVFDAVALATRAMGSTSQEAAHALLALEQMVSKGTVSMEELRRQLGNALPGAFQIAARALGVTTEELNKMVKAGSLEAIPFVEAFSRQLRVEFAGAVEVAANTTDAAFKRLGNSLLRLQETIAQSGLLNFLRDTANALSELLDLASKFGASQEKEAGPGIVPLPPTIAVP